MAVPPGLGVYLDSQFGTTPWLTILGAVLGLVLGLWHLVRLSDNRQPRTGASPDATSNEKRQ